MSSKQQSGSDGAVFKSQLGTSVSALFAGKRSTDVPTATSTAIPAGAALEHAVKDQLDKGASLDDVIAKLAGSLATSVAAALGIPAQAAQQRLTQAFTQALTPTDTGPPRSNADRASALVSRLRQIAELATGVTNGDTGQTIRLIAGQRSDAAEAKAVQAPQPDSILRDALAALAAPASPVTGATTVAPDSSPVTSASSVAPAAAGDGRVVALDATAQAIATGGDTPLGRIMTRALLAGDEPAAPVAGPILGTGLRAAGSNPPAAPTLPVGIVTAAGTAPAVGTAPAAATAVLDAFVQAFSTALARADDAAPAAAPSPQPALSYAIPFVHDAAPVAPPAPAPTMPQAQHVDANAVVDQILRGMAIRTTDGQSEVRLRLVPENLGDVSVKLTVTAGVVDASITAHTADAQNALAGGQNQLAKTLADAGLKLQSFTVGLAGGGFADARDQSRQHDSGNRPGSRRSGGVESVDTGESDDALLANPSFGPPIYSARSLPGTLNRLA